MNKQFLNVFIDVNVYRGVPSWSNIIILLWNQK